jgi:hypothetical protein
MKNDLAYYNAATRNRSQSYLHMDICTIVIYNAIAL